eukprot:4820341-Pleurochrysis_carterae.AAC.2
MKICKSRQWAYIKKASCGHQGVHERKIRNQWIKSTNLLVETMQTKDEKVQTHREKITEDT